MMSVSPSLAVISPFRMALTPSTIGNFKSVRYDFEWVLSISFAREYAVSTPSATSFEDLMISDSFSPFPMRIPRFLFLESGPKHVPNVSPTPESPARVDDFPPSRAERFCISRHPTVTRAAMALVPRPRPSLMPAANAMTFLTAPPTSRPITSLDVKTRNEDDDMKSRKSFASIPFFDAITTAVAFPSTISRANEGPERKA
mmetsp:Transcript_35131/g.47476  ORF Transcript_35131/g.47476 Transcript_35131/m.47476 type:complete len:201 (-) Transcript_35131:211-813(-)